MVQRATARAIAAVTFAATVPFVTAVALRDPPPDETEVRDRPIESRPDEYASSRACAACHPSERASWSASYHSSMTQVATPRSVLGDFDDVELHRAGRVFRLARVGDELWVDLPPIGGAEQAGAPRMRRKIVLTTGSHHMQAYWYATGNTRVLGLLPFVFHRELGRWVPREASFLQPPLEQPSLEIGRWNKICIECHVTLGRLLPVEPHGNDTRVAEFGIACESCHGPASDHVAANRSIVRRYALHLSQRGDPTIVEPRRLPHDRSSEICGQCHSTSIWADQASLDHWMQHGFPYRPGDRLEDTKRIVRGRYEANSAAVQAVLALQPEFLRNTFWPDGMNRVSGREYNMLLETPCFTRGELSCLSCHEMHRDPDDPRPVEEWADDQLAPGMNGNRACQQCHRELETEERLRAHTRHAPGSTGSLCYNCHMPYTTYGLLKAIRSHQITSPSVATSLDSGRPVACNQCHLDRSLGWSARWLAEWYAIPAPELTGEQQRVSASVLWALRGDAGQRALAAWTMGWDSALAASGHDWQALYLGLLLADPYDAVRFVAQRSLRALPGFEELSYDFLASESERQRSGNAVINAWLARRDPRAAYGPAILIDAAGRPDMTALLSLLRERDDTPIHFAE